MKNENRFFKKSDLLLVLCVITLSVLLLFAFFISKEKGAEITVKVGSQTLGMYSLREDREIPIITEHGSNTLVIEDGCAYIKDADCPDRLCTHTGKISETGESIVCLPHRVSVTVIS